ncbi:RrF2 family transcriptional regulator [Chitinophaga qingshengii]|uniref:Rrf2 family transcriptional regulator n=1 Tax=Chitinophaga qingshengii TaxID=1569794 RepID=A0ABR7TQ31_9BACT|nr:Rrf2 family transcriptional regulator [Chitinophaga qingshengii]MBC9932073.1 Rrf2 family transcriptional regulator [Chitinophaga qingshengii]
MLSKTAEYALRATIYIALKGSEDNKLGIEEIAKGIDSPRSFTAKILQLLTQNNRVISSVRGPNGGFYLTDRARKLPVKAILAAVEEENVITKCVLGLKECSETRPCPMHTQYKNIKKQLKQMFEKTAIQQLVDEFNKGNYFIDNLKGVRKPC